MPHKRAKRTTREQVRDQRGTDWAPGKDSLTNEPIPKSASRILNASKIRDDFKLKKRKLEDGDDGERQGKRRKSDGKKSGTAEKGKKGSQLTIKPGESIQHFNRRVEDDLRPLIKSAMHTSNAVARGVARKEMEDKAQAKQAKAKNMRTPLPAPRSPSPSPPPEKVEKHEGRPKEFQSLSTSAPRRLNDIAQAPPELKKFPRGAAAAAGSMGKRVDGVLSMAQKAMMEQERLKAVSRYRELKASRRQTGEGGDERARGDDDDE